MINHPNGWPGEPGVPLNPEQSGWHWFVRGDFYSLALWHRGHFTFQDTTAWPEEFSQLDMAYVGPALTPAEVEAQANDALKWRDAINDALTEWHDPPREGETPKAALRRLVHTEILAALDPAVSRPAADLVANARRDALKEAAQEMDCACPQRGAVLAKLAKDGPLSHHWPCEKSDDCCALRGAAIRALKGEGGE
jgi:hypothetical protein